ncbi:MAG: class I mannose-6-phosphate isomerase [Acidimicrobiia bacterium]|nr:class I mannose-6-phosphate isomerase [Acidimicrobiia bacterium]
MSLSLAPFTLRPVLVAKPWGGRRLESYDKDLPADVMIGESWEVADLPDHVTDVADPCSLVASGPLAGRSLRSVIEVAGEELLGPVLPTEEGQFPLLVKLLDAREHLSVQVHPHAEYVAEHPGTRLKTESWYVVATQPGSVLFHGLRKDADLDSVHRTIGTPEIVPHLRTIAAEPGSFHHVPAGLVHSLGAGVMVAEIQVPSDTTFRLYDWADEYGRTPRQMHYEQGAASMLLDPPDAESLPAVTGFGVRDLIANEHYWMREHRQPIGPVALDGRPGPRVLMAVEGRVLVEDLVLSAGTTAIVPAAVVGQCDVRAADDAVFLEVGITP